MSPIISLSLRAFRSRKARELQQFLKSVPDRACVPDSIISTCGSPVVGSRSQRPPCTHGKVELALQAMGSGGVQVLIDFGSELADGIDNGTRGPPVFVSFIPPFVSVPV